MTKTLELFNYLYEIYTGYNYFEYDDVILFDYVNADDEIQTIKYIKNEDKIITFVLN